jgi:hypothetical protein
MAVMFEMVRVVRGKSRVAVDAPKAPGWLESMLLQERRILEYRDRRAVSHDPAGVENHGAGAEIKDQLEIVRRHEAGLGAAHEKLNEPPPGAVIEIRGRLVEKERAGSERENRGQGGAALLSSGETMRMARPEPAESDCGEARSNARGDLVFTEAEIARAEGDVLGNTRHEELIVGILKEQADLAGAQ